MSSVQAALPSSFPKFFLGCLGKLESRYPAVATVQEAQIVQGSPNHVRCVHGDHR